MYSLPSTSCTRDLAPVGDHRRLPAHTPNERAASSPCQDQAPHGLKLPRPFPLHRPQHRPPATSREPAPRIPSGRRPLYGRMYGLPVASPLAFELLRLSLANPICVAHPTWNHNYEPCPTNQPSRSRPRNR